MLYLTTMPSQIEFASTIRTWSLMVHDGWFCQVDLLVWLQSHLFQHWWLITNKDCSLLIPRGNCSLIMVTGHGWRRRLWLSSTQIGFFFISGLIGCGFSPFFLVKSERIRWIGMSTNQVLGDFSTLPFCSWLCFASEKEKNIKEFHKHWKHCLVKN